MYQWVKLMNYLSVNKVKMTVLISQPSVLPLAEAL